MDDILQPLSVKPWAKELITYGNGTSFVRPLSQFYNKFPSSYYWCHKCLSSLPVPPSNFKAQLNTGPAARERHTRRVEYNCWNFQDKNCAGNDIGVNVFKHGMHGEHTHNTGCLLELFLVCRQCAHQKVQPTTLQNESWQTAINKHFQASLKLETPRV
jgi:hypothetical protein